MATLNRIQSSNKPLLLPEVPVLEALLPGPIIKPEQIRSVDMLFKNWWTQVQLALRTALDTFASTVNLKSLRLNIALKNVSDPGINDDDFTCICVAPLEMELPPAGASNRRLLYFKPAATGQGLITLVGNRGQKLPELIDGQLTLVLSGVTLLHCDGKAWYSL